MNRRKEWKKLLSIANADLKLYGYEIKIIPDGMGAYDCDIYKDGELDDNYAGWAIEIHTQAHTNI